MVVYRLVVIHFVDVVGLCVVPPGKWFSSVKPVRCNCLWSARQHIEIGMSVCMYVGCTGFKIALVGEVIMKNTNLRYRSFKNLCF